jgi:hypothetical protein
MPKLPPRRMYFGVPGKNADFFIRAGYGVSTDPPGAFQPTCPPISYGVQGYNAGLNSLQFGDPRRIVPRRIVPVSIPVTKRSKKNKLSDRFRLNECMADCRDRYPIEDEIYEVSTRKNRNKKKAIPGSMDHLQNEFERLQKRRNKQLDDMYKRFETYGDDDTVLDFTVRSRKPRRSRGRRSVVRSKGRRSAVRSKGRRSAVRSKGRRSRGSNYVMNPLTGRYVKKTGSIGKKVLKLLNGH